jgi:predicted O-methyltransferase YrrM
MAAAAAMFGADGRWLEVEQYMVDTLLGPDPVLEQALRASEAGGLPPIAVSPNQGKLLHLLARVQGARAILELGTLGAYSTIWLARALPDGGRLITVEANSDYARVAAANIAAAGLDDVVDQRVADALEELAELQAQGTGPFDLLFIDADKQRIPQYFSAALALSRTGSVIVVDNVVRGAAIVDPASEDAGVLGIRRFYELAAAEPRVSTSAIQTVGSKGYDGFAIALVTG